MEMLPDGNELYEGDFIDPQKANEMLIEHLASAIILVQKSPVSSPASIGILARSLEMICYRCTTVPHVSSDYHPYEMFWSAVEGDGSGWILPELGFDESLSNKMRAEHKECVGGEA
jgi:hypothetical protein